MIPRYALTYPQLIAQALRHGYDEPSLLRLKRTHDIARRLFDGVYRAQGSPFLCHLIRTASITMEHSGSVDTVLAALLHAVYVFGIFSDGKAGDSNAHREEIRKVIGVEAEQLVIEYMRTSFHNTDALNAHLKNPETISPKTKDILLISLANELEDYLDLQMVLRGGDRYKREIERYGKTLVTLAKGLGHVTLGEELEEVFKQSLQSSIPELLKSDRTSSYELDEHLQLRKGKMGLLRSILRRRIQKFLR